MQQHTSISSERREVLARLATRILTLDHTHPVKIAIDGGSASGKTTLADELEQVLIPSGREIIRASIDGFHNPKQIRYQHGSTPFHYFRDSFDYSSLHSWLIEPFRKGGTRSYKTAVYDFRTESSVIQNPRIADRDAIVLIDGVFLLREGLYQSWDFKVYLDVSFSVMLDRAMERDKELFGGKGEVIKKYMTRYIPGQRSYIERHRPYERADVVIDNNDPSSPQMV